MCSAWTLMRLAGCLGLSKCSDHTTTLPPLVPAASRLSLGAKPMQVMAPSCAVVKLRSAGGGRGEEEERGEARWLWRRKGVTEEGVVVEEGGGSGEGKELKRKGVAEEGGGSNEGGK